MAPFPQQRMGRARLWMKKKECDPRLSKIFPAEVGDGSAVTKVLEQRSLAVTLRKPMGYIVKEFIRMSL